MNAKIHKYSSLLLSILCSLFSILSFSQTYQWDWAKRGGGSNSVFGETEGTLNNFAVEMIWDIVVDEQNNYYFLGKISSGTTTVDGNEVTTFGNNAYGNNIIITSFTCDGTYRWSRVIGGGGYNSGDHAHKLVLDNNGGIYVHMKVANTTGSNGQSPVYFSENDSLPYLTGDWDEIQEGYKKGFLLKYDTDNGNLIWRKGYQGDVNYYNAVRINHLQIDSNNVLHTIIGLTEGVHLDGALNIELEEGLEYYLVKFDGTTGNLIDTPLLLPLEGSLKEDNTSFRYDENLNRYYLAGWNFGSNFYTLTFNGVAFGNPDSSNNHFAYLLSFNPDNLQNWWYREFTGTGDPRIEGIEIDSNSDIYIGGAIHMSSNSTNTVFFGDYSFSSVYSGNRLFILKMNSDGEVQWSKMPSGYIASEAGSGGVRGLDMAINGNEVALAAQGWSVIWDSFSIDRPSGHRHDPTLVRFNKQTGEVIGLHDIYGSVGTDHFLTAVTTDNDGNYVVGGAMGSSLFTNNPNGINTLYNIGVGGYDFFMARLAATPCGTPVASNNSFNKQTLRLYPNPTNGLVYVKAQDLQSYEVYNLLGQRLLSGNGNTINLQDVSKGTYIVKVKTQNGEVLTSKVVKQ